MPSTPVPMIAALLLTGQTIFINKAKSVTSNQEREANVIKILSQEKVGKRWDFSISVPLDINLFFIWNLLRLTRSRIEHAEEGGSAYMEFLFYVPIAGAGLFLEMIENANRLKGEGE